MALAYQAMACDFESEGESEHESEGESEHESERTRRAELAKQLRSLGLGLLQVEFYIERTLPLETHGVQPNLYLSVRGNTVLLERSGRKSKLATHTCMLRAPIRHLYIIWRTKSAHQMEFLASSWLSVVRGSNSMNESKFAECWTFRPTPHSCGWIL